MTYSLFAGHRRIASAELADIAVTVASMSDGLDRSTLLVFDDSTGKQLDVDASGPESAIRARYSPVPAEPAAAETSRGPGRPRLGVVPREVTLLPHHWEWLNAQPGGASVTLRKLVEQARKHGAADERIRLAREASYRFVHAIAGNLPDFEEVTRALFAGDLPRMDQLMLDWPEDVRHYALQLASAGA